MTSFSSEIGPYTIARELGRGGMGVVYLGRDTRLDRDVAIKALPEALAQDPERLARFEREAKTLASLNHPNVAGIHGVEEHEGGRYLVLEYVEGETLTEKPVELARLAIEYSSRPGERVLDLFGGSGSTLIACEQTGRRAFLMEIDPAYCDVIVERWERFTGRKAERESTIPDDQACERHGALPGPS